MQAAYILLDIDGVMITAASWQPVSLQRDGFYTFSATAQEQLDWLLAQSGAQIILTTTHRTRFSNEGWEQIFRERCPHLQGIQVIDDFKLDCKAHHRLAEVKTWAQRFGQDARYVILDDDSSLDALPPEVKKNWVRIMPFMGLDHVAAAKALAILQTT